MTFALPREIIIAALLVTLALHRYRRGELVSSTEFVNLISHRKKILKELTSNAIFSLNIINSTISTDCLQLPFTSPVSLNEYL